jgi:hypothetical protein
VLHDAAGICFGLWWLSGDGGPGFIPSDAEYGVRGDRKGSLIEVSYVRLIMRLPDVGASGASAVSFPSPFICCRLPSITLLHEPVSWSSRQPLLCDTVMSCFPRQGRSTAGTA